MTIRENAIAKLQRLPDTLLLQVNDFIDFLTSRRQPLPNSGEHQASVTETWIQWFTAVDHLQVKATEPTSDYQQHLLLKYRKQGLEL